MNDNEWCQTAYADESIASEIEEYQLDDSVDFETFWVQLCETVYKNIA
jgi:hypothetical protein